MAGVSIEIDTRGQAALRRALDSLARRAGDLNLVLRDIGEELLNRLDDRWDAAVSADGTPWTPLSEATLAQKRRPDILVESDRLRRLAYKVRGGGLAVGTNVIYGAIHQLGGEAGRVAHRVTLPARPFLGLSEDDRSHILEIVQEHLGSAIR